MRNDKGGKRGEGDIEEKYEGSSRAPCMAASSTDRLPPAGCTIAVVSTFFAPPSAYLSMPRILHLQGGVTLKTLPVLNYPVLLSPSLSLCLTHFFHSSPIVSFLSVSPLLHRWDYIIPEKCVTSETRAMMTDRTPRSKSVCLPFHVNEFFFMQYKRILENFYLSQVLEIFKCEE